MSAGDRAFAERVFTALRAKWNSTNSMNEIQETSNLYRNRYPGKEEIVDRELDRFRKGIFNNKTLTSSDNACCSIVTEVGCSWTYKLVEVA